MGRIRTVFLKEGDQFGKLTVIDPEAGRIARNRARPKGTRTARVSCECGTVKLVAISNLRSGGTVSCGCARQGRWRT